MSGKGKGQVDLEAGHGGNPPQNQANNSEYRVTSAAKRAANTVGTAASNAAHRATNALGNAASTVASSTLNAAEQAASAVGRGAMHVARQTGKAALHGAQYVGNAAIDGADHAANVVGTAATTALGHRNHNPESLEEAESALQQAATDLHRFDTKRNTHQITLNPSYVFNERNFRKEMVDYVSSRDVPTAARMAEIIQDHILPESQRTDQANKAIRHAITEAFGENLKDLLAQKADYLDSKRVRKENWEKTSWRSGIKGFAKFVMMGIKTALDGIVEFFRSNGIKTRVNDVIGKIVENEDKWVESMLESFEKSASLLAEENQQLHEPSDDYKKTFGDPKDQNKEAQQEIKAAGKHLRDKHMKSDLSNRRNTHPRVNTTSKGNGRGK